MNKYEKYILRTNYFNRLLFGANANLYLKQEQLKREHNIRNKYYTDLRNALLLIKQNNEVVNKVKPVYKDEDLEYIKDLDCYDLTYEEALLLGKGEEYRNYQRIFYSSFSFSSKKNEKEFLEEIDKLGDNFTFRVMYDKVKELKKESK